MYWPLTFPELPYTAAISKYDHNTDVREDVCCLVQEVNGVLVAGSIDPAQLKGPLRGKSVKDMKDRADDGDLYVLVVTMQNPNGGLRGQVGPA